MILFTIEGTTAQGNLIRDAICTNYGYQDIIDDYPNPETKAQFTKRQINEFIKNNVKSYKAKQAEATRLGLLVQAEEDIGSLTVI